jgi:hypothetical protein
MASLQSDFALVNSAMDLQELSDVDLLRYYLWVHSSKSPIKAGDSRDSVIVSIALEQGDDYPKRVAAIGLSYMTYNDKIDYLCTNNDLLREIKGDVKTLVRKIIARHAQVPEAQCSSDLLTFRYGSVERLTQVGATQYTMSRLLDLADSGRKQLIILTNSPRELDFYWWNYQGHNLPPPHPYMAFTDLKYHTLDVDNIARKVRSSFGVLCAVGQNDLYDNGHTPPNTGNKATWNLLLAIVVANFGDYDSTSHTIMGQTIADLAQYLENQKTRERLNRLKRALRVEGGERQRTRDAFTPY